MVQSNLTLLCWIVLVSVHFILKNANIHFNIVVKQKILLRIPKKVTGLKMFSRDIRNE